MKKSKARFKIWLTLLSAVASAILLFPLAARAGNSDPLNRFPQMPQGSLVHLTNLDEGVVETASLGCPGYELQRAIVADALAGFTFQAARKSAKFKSSKVVVDAVYLDQEEDEHTYDKYGNEIGGTKHTYNPILMTTIPTARLKMVNPHFGRDKADNLGRCSLGGPGISEDEYQAIVNVFISNGGTFQVNSKYISLSLPSATALGGINSN